MATYSQPPWEEHKAAITQLYAVKTLQQVTDEMKERYGFTATKKQWKTQLTKWGLDKKNIKPAEYRAMVRKKREREENDPAKAIQFILHGVEVSPNKIARFESREGRNKGINGRQGDALTPPGLTCRTPPIKQDSGDVRRNPTIDIATSCDYTASHDRNLIQTQLVPRDSTASMQTIPPRLTIRSPSSGSFDWFKEYIDYSESVNGSPTIVSSNPLMEMLLSFQKVLDNYEDERAYKSFTEGLRLVYDCNKCRIIDTIVKLQYGFEGADAKMSKIKIENWARASVEKAIQLYGGRDDAFMARVGEAVGELYLFLGREWEAKPYLEQSILEMKRLGASLRGRKEATIALAKCCFDLGGIQQAGGLLGVLFKTGCPKIVASSYLALESHCREFRRGLLKICYSKAEDNLVQDANDRVGYKWEKDDMGLQILVNAAKLIRKFNPGIIEEMEGCDNSFEYSGAAKDEVDDGLDKGMQSNEQ